jgi:Trypsin
MVTRAILFLAAAAAAAVLASPGRAITNGEPDTAHGAVGALLADFPGFGIFPTCTGTLLSPTIFLTSAHCTEDTGGGDILGVSFDPAPPSVSPPSIGIKTKTLFPGFVPGDPFTDLEVIELEEPVTGVTPAQLPPLGSLGDKHDATDGGFTVVGYGSPGLVPSPGGKAQLLPDIRRFTTTKLDGYVRPKGARRGDASVSSLLKFSASGGHGGGVCFGDSGGPTFVDDSNVIAGIAVLAQKNCNGIYEALRLDTLPVLSFLSAFVPVP